MALLFAWRPAAAVDLCQTTGTSNAKLVKTQCMAVMVPVYPDGTRNFSKEIYAHDWTFSSFTPETRAAKVYPGADPGVRTQNPVTKLPASNIDGVAGNEAPALFDTKSLFDRGVWSYLVTATSGRWATVCCDSNGNSVKG